VITAARATQKETVFRLDRLELPLYGLDPQGRDEILASILRIGELMSREQESQRLVGDLRAQLSTVEGRLSEQRPVGVLYLLYQPLMTVGRGSFLPGIVSSAGGDNLDRDAALRYAT
jgi:iron complex transport system substrate-binding protein